MIKPINISASRSTNEFLFRCNNCNQNGYLKFEGMFIDVDNEKIIKDQLRNLYCPKCGDNNLLDEIIL